MSIFLTSLNSGSNGNCYYIGNGQEAILVDAGLSCRETEKRMKRLGLSMEQVRAIFISHEHTDHIKGIPVIAKKYQLPIYITADTLKQGGLALDAHLVFPFRAYEPVLVGAFAITAFPKFHDAADPHSFIITSKGLQIGVFTDIGAPCEHLIRHFQQCHAAFLEANYDEEMLEQGSYPYYLKNRIRGGQGHLSNRQALELFQAHRPSCMSHLFLSHLSKNNNSEDLVRDLFNRHADGVKIILATRFEETAIYTITGEERMPALAAATIRALVTVATDLMTGAKATIHAAITEKPAAHDGSDNRATTIQPPGKAVNRQKPPVREPQQYSLF